MVELLLEAGADVNSLDYHKSKTALFAAIRGVMSKMCDNGRNPITLAFMS